MCDDFSVDTRMPHVNFWTFRVYLFTEFISIYIVLLNSLRHAKQGNLQGIMDEKKRLKLALEKKLEL